MNVAQRDYLTPVVVTVALVVALMVAVTSVAGNLAAIAIGALTTAIAWRAQTDSFWLRLAGAFTVLAAVGLIGWM